jgi:exodeoxyribonuclease-3
VNAANGEIASITRDYASRYQQATSHLRVLTWNVQHASPLRSSQQAAWIAAQPADVVVLTEVSTTGGGQALVRSLREQGFSVYCMSVPGDYGVVVASRTGTQEPYPQVGPSHLPHRFAAIRLNLGARAAGIVGLYVPSRGSPERRNVDKRAFQEAVTRLLPKLTKALIVNGPIVIAGDLNVVEPGHQPHHAVFGKWEYEFYDAFGESGYGDAFRHLHPRQADHSWFGRRSGRGYRFDHIFCSRLDAVRDCRYLHEPRLGGLSDHSAMIATVAVSPQYLRAAIKTAR